ncbi:MAG: hypothetical protein EOP43_07625 [Sphingobacteriaceae bacterium]|nr:MAG: hypothetical protein EOP43_07625 [Sphingobacteriaceae bacterium]
MKKLLLVLFLSPLFGGCGSDQKSSETTTQLKSKVRDSLDKVAIKLTGSDFCTILTEANLISAEAEHRAEKKYPLPDPNQIIFSRRVKLASSFSKHLYDSTKLAYKWPDTIFMWAIKNSVQLDTPCNKISRYRIMESIGRDKINGNF